LNQEVHPDDADAMKNKKIVITGGAGFIGSNLAEAFSKENEVVVVDNLSTGRLENIKPLVKARKVKFVRGSVGDLKLMKKACKSADIVLHYAAIPSVPLSVKDPLIVNKSGVDATLTALVAARDADVDKFVYASSSAIYGDTKALPVKEDTPLKALSPYAVTKIAGEHYCRVFDDLYGMETVSLRYYNVYGPRQNPKSEYAAVVPKFISNALSGNKLTIYGDGRQTRDFLYVKDVVAANELATKSGVAGAFNISSGQSVTINSLAKIVLVLAGRDVGIVYEPARKGEILRSEADVSKARKELGFVPGHSLEKGLRETISSFSKKDKKPKRR
jgi:UDP-glucose 4-epimerase